MGFLKWMETRNKFVKLIMCFVNGWRAYALLRKIFEKQNFTKEIVYAIFFYVFNFLDFWCVLFTGRPFGIKNLDLTTVIDE